MITPPDFQQRFVSTRGIAEPVDLATAVLTGPATDGGLWVPETLIPFSPAELEELESYDFQKLATAVGHRLLGADIDVEQLKTLVREALDFEIPLRRMHARNKGGALQGALPALDPPGTDPLSTDPLSTDPLSTDPPDQDLHVLELFHGPTLAFKDVGARFMARLLGWARQQRVEDGETIQDLTILVATSGDTGSAVAHAFLGVEGFRVVVLFPKGQVSEAQRKLFTTLGQNTHSLCIDGSFDDCQRLVKQAFADGELRRHMPLGSANSINIARLLPQSFYYFWLRSQLSAEDKRRPFCVCTPSGNFGNLTAGVLAKRLGLPIDHFIAATNNNDIVPQFLQGGDFLPRPSVATLANAMDVGDPSNFERILWLYHGDEAAVRQDISGAHYTDQEISAAIDTVNQRYGLLLDPHSAIGFLGARDHQRSLQARGAGTEGGPSGETADRTVDGNLKPCPSIYAFLATAHPAKFAEVVGNAIGQAVSLPPTLARALEGAELVDDMHPDYQTLRNFLEGL